MEHLTICLTVCLSFKSTTIQTTTSATKMSPPAINGINWEKLCPSNWAIGSHQFFRDIEEFNEDATAVELSIWSFTKIEMFNNYNNLKVVCNFLVSNNVIISERYMNSNPLLMRVIGTIWPEEEHLPDSKEAFKRLNGHKNGSIFIPLDGNY